MRMAYVISLGCFMFSASISAHYGFDLTDSDPYTKADWLFRGSIVAAVAFAVIGGIIEKQNR